LLSGLNHRRIFVRRIRAGFRRVRFVRLAEDLSNQATLVSPPQGTHNHRTQDRCSTLIEASMTAAA
jgi:hypothetical protein